jgi:electron transport complex protein RnfD
MIGSPFVLKEHNSVRFTMIKVMAALLPGTIAYAWLFGPGIWISLIWCSLLGIGFEALALLMRGKPMQPMLSDGSVLLTAWLFALSVPTLGPWWLYFVGMLFAVLVAKHLYGGLGQNLFNPAMVGYGVLIISFPVYMTQWPATAALANYVPNLSDAFDLVFSGGSISPDAYTSATVLDSVKTAVRGGHTVADALAQPIRGLIAGKGTELVSVMYLFGGLFLLGNRLITWHIPLAFLAAVALTAGVLQYLDPAHHAGPLFHLFAGGTMLGAFFIATDPVTACTTPVGKLIFAGLAGFLTVIIRTWGGFPDGVAFSVLIMNTAAPLIDAYTQPRVFGHARGGKTAG